METLLSPTWMREKWESEMSTIRLSPSKDRMAYVSRQDMKEKNGQDKGKERENDNMIDNGER